MWACRRLSVRREYFGTGIASGESPLLNLRWGKPIMSVEDRFNELARDKRGPRPAERIEDRVAGLAAVAERTLDEFHRLHRGVLQVRHGPLDEPHVALVP